MIIDGHSHVILPAEKHIQIMNKAGVNKTILFSTSVHPENAKDLKELKIEMKKLNDVVGGKSPSLIYTKRKSIEELMTVIKSYPDRYIGFGNVPLGVNENETNLFIGENIANNKLAGIGEFTPASGQVKLLDIIFKASMNFGRLPIWIHGFNPLVLQDIKNIAALCKAYPDIPVILGHLGGSNWMTAIELAKEIPNLYLDTSAYFSTLVLKIVINDIPQKCIFGVDMPYGDLQLSLDAVRKVCKDSYVEDAVLGNNVAKLLKL
ncbi:amidohydrolase family protein [Clostridium sp. YIM B02555]|jgi:predicted TIM-barrel fold metal-dependent hydrolase|uniref:amidohydrolase family protein n=1 Tax=Clostridium sp. YIM B02555 TaxID=2911968 RepID=UPI001EEF2C1B|nr:amidohydrolase family protein [Clostridium sp. YIM B02555]